MWQATREAVELDLGSHVGDRQTYVIQHHRSGRGYDNMNVLIFCRIF